MPLKKKREKENRKRERRKIAVTNILSVVKAEEEFQQPKKKIFIKGQTTIPQLY